MIKIYKSIRNSAGNSNTHTELSNVCHSQHADLVCIFEPVVTLGSISLAFWDSLDLSLTVVNNKGDLLRNMWIVHSPTRCSHYVISSTTQHITIQTSFGGVLSHFTIVYAAITSSRRRKLWCDFLGICSYTSVP